MALNIEFVKQLVLTNKTNLKINYVSCSVSKTRLGADRDY